VGILGPLAISQLHKNNNSNPSHLNLVLDMLEVRPSRALVVGDTTLDVLCARAAGVRSVGVLTGVHKRDQLESVGVDYINRLDELPRLIQKIDGEEL